MADRVRAQNLGADFTVLAQGIPFLHAGADLLRSKSLDRNSYDSGDWFNRLDFTGQTSAWGSRLPPAADNADNWPLMRPLLADAALKPAPSDIAAANTHMAEMLKIRNSSRLFRLRTEKQIEQRLEFANTGPDQVPGLIVMGIADQGTERLAGGDLDPNADGVLVLFNATDEQVSYTSSEAKGSGLVLHPVQAASADPVVRSAAFDRKSGEFTVPASTTAVFVDVADNEPPVASAELKPIWVGTKAGWFRVQVDCTDNVTRDCRSEADLNGVEVADGDLVALIVKPGRTKETTDRRTGIHWFYAPSFELTVTCTDDAGNSATATATPKFRKPGWPPGWPWLGWDHRSLS